MGNKATWNQLIAGVEKKLRKKKSNMLYKLQVHFPKLMHTILSWQTLLKQKLIIFHKLKQYQVTIIFHFGISKKLDTLWIATHVLN